MPAQDRIRAYQQPQPAQRLPRQAVQQRGEEGTIGWSEPRPLVAQLTLQHGELVTQGQNFRVLVPVAHREQPQHRKEIHHSQVGQS